MKQLFLLVALLANPSLTYSHHTEDPNNIIWRNARDVFHGNTTGMTIEVGRYCAVKIYPRKDENTRPIEDKIVKTCQALRERWHAKENRGLSRAAAAVSAGSAASVVLGNLAFPVLLKAFAIAGSMLMPPLIAYPLYKYIYGNKRGGNGWPFFGLFALAWGLSLGAIALLGLKWAGTVFASILAVSSLYAAKSFREQSDQSKSRAEKLQKEADDIRIP